MTRKMWEGEGGCDSALIMVEIHNQKNAKVIFV